MIACPKISGVIVFLGIQKNAQSLLLDASMIQGSQWNGA